MKKKHTFTQRQLDTFVANQTREHLSRIASKQTPAKLAAARANLEKVNALKRTTPDKLVAALRAVKGGMTPTRAAKEVAHCRLPVLQEFLARHGLKVKRYRPRENAPAETRGGQGSD